MAVNKSNLWLKGGITSLGSWASPETIGTDAAFPSSKFTGSVLGSIKRGTQVINLPAEYVRAEVTTPAKLFRTDPIRLGFTIEGDVYEFDSTTLGTLFNLNTQASYAVTTPSAKTIDLHHIGSDAPVLTEQGLLIQSTLVDGRDAEIAMYAGLLKPEDRAVNLSGDDYAVVRLMAEATPDSGFTTLAQDQKNYGYIMIDRT